MSSATTVQKLTVEIGDIFYESWGYDQTQNDFAQVVRLSASSKSAICRMMRSERVSGSTVKPSGEAFGVEFRLKLDHWIDNEGHDRGLYLRGSYPYVQQPDHPSEDQRVSMRGPVSFARYEHPVYETPNGQGH